VLPSFWPISTLSSWSNCLFCVWLLHPSASLRLGMRVSFLPVYICHLSYIL
jgi:hypothetical protein